MSEINQISQFPKPDFSQITERPRKSHWKKSLVLLIKIVLVILVLAIISLGVLGILYYKDLQEAYSFSLSAKGNLDLALHQLINREFKEAAASIKLSNDDFKQAQTLLDKIKIVRSLPYLGQQLKAVDQVLIAGIKLTDSGQKVVLLIDDITAPLKNESITYATLTSEQKHDILDKIVKSEDLLYEVQKEIDEADAAIGSIPQNQLVKPLRDGIAPLRENLPKIKALIDHALPMLDVIPSVVGFDRQRAYLFLFENNYELRPTGGFIGTYGILKLKDGEIKDLQTDNVYNLDASTQSILKEPSPFPIVKYLEQKYWSLRDINWAPDFPTTAVKALYMYKEENRIQTELKAAGKPIKGEAGIIIPGTIPYQEVDGVIAMTPEVIADLLKLTGPITVEGMMFNDQNLTDQLENIVGLQYKQLGTPIAQRKAIIRELADQIKLKLFSLPVQRVNDILNIIYKALAQKEVLIYSNDQILENLVLARGWGGEIQKTDNDYLMVVDSNMASLKTDQYIDRSINYTFENKNGDLVAKVNITYKNNADFTWKSTRLRTYTRVYVPLGSELISSQGAMENDKIKDPGHQAGQIEKGQEFDKTYFGAFISIEPHETGILSFEYKLPKKILEQINLGTYNLLIQKQPGVVPNLTLALKFDKNIKSAIPAEEQKDWFNTSYNLSTALDTDKQMVVSFK